MSRFHLALFGGFSIRKDGEPFDGFATDKVRALLAYLALEPDKPHRRSNLATLYWADWDERSALANLRKSLFRLRQGLDELHAGSADDLLESTSQSILFHSGHMEVDALRFQELLHQSEIHQHTDREGCPACRDRQVEAAALYRGDLLAGLVIDGARPFEEWVTVRQERLHRQAMDLLENLTNTFMRETAFDKAIAYADRMVELEPWHESAHRQLMLLFAATGRQEQAIRQYEKCRLILEEELGVLPSGETDQLLAEIKQGRVALAQDRPARGFATYGFPPQITTFVGRDSEVQLVLDRLADPAVRLLTLTGFGGSGKTSLAGTVANRLAFEDQDALVEARYVSLAAVPNASVLASVVAAQLGLALEGADSPETQVVNFLQRQPTLLVLDNYEQLLPDTALVERILNETPGTKVLVTSRAPLKLRTEWRIPLRGLEVPDEDDSMEALQNSEAVRLFETIARQTEPAFRITEDNASTVARICRRLDGIPLALEIAGSWLHIYTLKELEQQIESDLHFLVTERRDVIDRHRSLEVIFDHSWSMLKSAEQVAFARLSCFRGTFSAGAARAITGSSVNELATLLDHALIRRDATGRYGLHPVLRDFAAARLEDADTISREHARWYMQILANSASLFATSQSAEAIRQIEADLSEIREAWQFAVDNQRVDWIEESLEGLRDFYDFRGLYAEGLRVFSAAVESALSAGANITLINRLRLATASYLENLGEIDEALALARQVYEAHEEATATNALLLVSHLYELQSNYEDAISDLELAINRLKTGGDSTTLARALDQLGRLYSRRNDYDSSIDAYTQALAMNRRLGNEIGNANIHAGLGLVHKDKGEYDTALRHIRQALVIAEQVNHRESIARFTQNIGLIYWQTGELEQAVDHYERALAIAEELGHRRGMAMCLASLGVIHRLRHEYDAALSLYEEALALFETMGSLQHCAIQLGNMGNVYMELGEFERARSYYMRALEIDRELGVIEGVSRHLGNMGDTYKDQQQYAEARACFEEGIPLLREIGGRYYLCWQLVSLAEVILEMGDLETVRTLIAEGGPMAQQLGRRDYYFRARLLEVRLEAIEQQDERALRLLEAIRSEFDQPEEVAEIAMITWQLIGDVQQRQLALKSFATLLSETRMYTYRRKLDYLQRSG